MTNFIAIWILSCLWFPAFTLACYEGTPTLKLMGVGFISFCAMIFLF